MKLHNNKTVLNGEKALKEILENISENTDTKTNKCENKYCRSKGE